MISRLFRLSVALYVATACSAVPDHAATAATDSAEIPIFRPRSADTLQVAAASAQTIPEANRDSGVVLAGRALTCNGPVNGISIWAFQVSQAGPLIAQLDAMEKFKKQHIDSTWFKRFDAMQVEMRKLIARGPALARATSAADGTFNLRIPPTDSVLIVSYADVEDDTYFYGFRTVPGEASISFILDMSHGQCRFA